MKPLIINVRGNSGSGKTYLTREFMKVCQHPVPLNDGQDTKMIYRKKTWVVLGRYGNVCGGCDTIKTQQEVIDRVLRYTAKGWNVWLEGIIISDTYGSLGAVSEQFGNRWLFAYLDTPLEVCLVRVQQRRDAKGTEKPFNPTKTVSRHRTILRNRERVLSFGRRVKDISYLNPLPALLSVIWKEAA